MTSEPTGAEALAAEPAQVPATVENAEATTAQQSEAENTGEASAPETTGAEPDAPAKRKPWFTERIDTLTRQRHEAERQAEYWKARAEQKVDTANLGYEEEIVERVSQRQRQEQAETAKATATNLAAEVFTYRETAAREKFADYDAVTRNPNVPITPAMADVIRDSDLGPELAYHLGRNIAEAAHIASLPPPRQAVELGKLEARIAAPKPVPAQPPAPVNPVSGIKAGGQKNPAEMSMEEFKAWREKS